MNTFFFFKNNNQHCLFQLQPLTLESKAFIYNAATCGETSGLMGLYGPGAAPWVSYLYPDEMSEEDEWPADVVKLGPAAHPFKLQGVEEDVHHLLGAWFKCKSPKEKDVFFKNYINGPEAFVCLSGFPRAMVPIIVKVPNDIIIIIIMFVFSGL